MFSEIKNEIREIENNGSELTLKSRGLEKNNILDRLELTTSVSSPETTTKILKSLGLRLLSEHKSEKEYWLFRKAKIVFARFSLPAKLEFMEIETNSSGEIEKILRKLQGKVKKADEKVFSVFDSKRK